MSNPLQSEASRQLEKIYQDLINTFSLAELEQMVISQDLSPLYQAVDRAYARIAEVALSLFLAGLGLVGDAEHPRLALDTARWRIAQDQAHVRTVWAKPLADDQKRVLQDVLTRGLGLMANRVAIRLRNALGLTLVQYQNLERYERTLSQSTRRETETGDLVTPGQVATMTGVRAAQDRATRIAVLGLALAQQAYGRAQLEVWEQAGESYLVDPSRVVRTWNVTGYNTRDSHWAMNGQKRALNEMFLSGNGNRLMYPGDSSAPANDVANCQCWLTYTVLR